MSEVLVYDDDGNVIDTYCEHEYNADGYCECCGDIKYMSPAYCSLYGCDMEFSSEL